MSRKILTLLSVNTLFAYMCVLVMIGLLSILVVVIGVLLYLTTVKPKNYPPGPRWYPIKGCVSVLKKYLVECGGQHTAFNTLAKKFNTNVLGLKLGKELVVVVLTYDIVKDVFKSEDFAFRPDNLFIRLRSLGTKKGITCADGELWSSQRNFLIRHFRNLGFGKERMQKMIYDELDDVLDSLESEGTEVEIGKLLSPAVISVLWRITAGYRIRRNDRQLEKILSLLNRRSKLFDMSGGILNMYPWLRFIAPEKSGYKLMKELNDEMKNFFVDVIREHYSNWKEGRNGDFIYVFISEMKKSMPDSYFTEEQLIVVCVDILIAGAQTTSNTLDFAFLMMILHKDIQNKVHQELDKAFSKQTTIEYNGKSCVPYVEAVIMEVERFCHVAPLSGPRRVLKDTLLEGYVIPKDATVLVSMHSVHMDEKFWGDPNVFRPERFLDNSGCLAVPKRFMPFGLGKRRCPGDSLARAFIFIFFTGIMHKFSISCPINKTPPGAAQLSGITIFPEKYVATFTKRC